MNRAINQIQALPIYDMRSVLVLAMFLLIADSNKWKARELSSTSQYSKVFCGLQTAGAQLNCFRSLLNIKSDFFNNKYSFISGHPNFWAPQPLYITLGTPTSGHPNFCTSNTLLRHENWICPKPTKTGRCPNLKEIGFVTKIVDL